jgi:hypothetical protein
MADLVNAQGSTLTTSGWTVYPIAMTIPGYEQSEIDKTKLVNSAVTTADVGTLKKYDPLVFMVAYDATTRETVPSANQVWTVTLPDDAGAYTFWGKRSKVGSVELVRDADQNEQLAYEITITLTNENGSGVETAPAFA